MRTALALLLCLPSLSAPDASAQTVLETAAQPRALVRATRRVEVRGELQAIVERLPFREGMAFAQGDTLVRFDCRRLQAELASAQAAARAREVELRAKRQMLAHGAAGRSEVDVARAEAVRGRASVDLQRARLAQCTITAPFAGRVVSVGVREHEMARSDDPVMVVLDDRDLELELVVPSRWLRWLRPQTAFTLHVDETETGHAAIVERIGAEVDPVSQTVRAFGRIDEPAPGVLAGMSGTARFSVPSR